MDEKRNEVLKCRKMIDEEWKLLLDAAKKFESLKNHDKKYEKDVLELEIARQKIQESNEDLQLKLKKFQAEKCEFMMEKRLLGKEKRDLQENRKELSLMIPSLKKLITTPK